MKFASFVRPDGRSGFGVVDAALESLAELGTADVQTLGDALRVWGIDGLRTRAAGARPSLKERDIRWLLPITDPAKILCVGSNYRRRAPQAAREQPAHPSIFVRFADSLVGHGEPTLRPFASEQLDYEAELAVVVGRSARHVRPEDALAYVAGYACFAENSVRDFQRHATQVTAGKTFHASGAFGPWFVSADEVPDPTRLEVIGRLNGVEMQRDSVSHMVFPIADLIAYISTFTPLEPGDVIVTGTPAGVGVGRKPPVYLKPGDVFEVEIPGVGLLRNPVAQEPETARSP